MKLLTFNLRIYSKNDDNNILTNRIDYILEFLLKEKYDIICFQELNEYSFNLLKPLLKYYNYCGLGRKENDSCESNKIYYKKDKFKLIFEETKWLSKTPDIAGSSYKIQTLPRIFTRVVLKYNSKDFCIYNTHFDHLFNKIRIKEAKILSRFIKEKNSNYPLILTGDFNSLPNSKPIKIISKILKDQTTNIKSTFHDFGKAKDNIKIDYIFTNDKIKKINTRLITNKYGDIYLSDHYPVEIEFEIK